MLKFTRLFLLVLFLTGSASTAYGFGEKAGACEDDCTNCHSLSIEEASDIVKQLNPDVEVVDIKLGPVGGLWEVTVSSRGKKNLAYVDFAKKHLIAGSIIRIKTQENITEQRRYELSKVDVTAIPLEEALVMGSKDARYRVIVFDDPE